jgi:hypothetical protein
MLGAVVFLYWWRSSRKLEPIRIATLTGKRILNQTEEAHV